MGTGRRGGVGWRMLQLAGRGDVQGVLGTGRWGRMAEEEVTDGNKARTGGVGDGECGGVRLKRRLQTEGRGGRGC